MTPDELDRLGGLLKRMWYHFVWMIICSYFVALFAIRGADHRSIMSSPACYLAPLGLFCTPYVGYLVYKLNGRIARWRLRKQDSIARLTKRHEKMLREIRKLEREVTERTEDLPPETIPVSMRDDSYNAKQHERSYP